MRRSVINSTPDEENEGINLTPMLDVVFIMLIFFIVTASFVKEAGIEVNRPTSPPPSNFSRARQAKKRLRRIKGRDQK